MTLRFIPALTLALLAGCTSSSPSSGSRAPELTSLEAVSFPGASPPATVATADRLRLVEFWATW